MIAATAPAAATLLAFSRNWRVPRKINAIFPLSAFSRTSSGRPSPTSTRSAVIPPAGEDGEYIMACGCTATAGCDSTSTATARTAKNGKGNACHSTAYPSFASCRAM